MSALSLGTILSNSLPQINTPNQNFFDYRKPTDPKDASNVQVIVRSKEYMEQMFDIIMPPLKHQNSTRLKSAFFVLKYIVGMIVEENLGRCFAKQSTIGEKLAQFGYSKDLGRKQVGRIISFLRELGLMTYERTGGNRSTYEYKPTQMGFDIYFYFIKMNKSCIKIECPDLPQSAVDKIFKKKKCPLETKKMSHQDFSQPIDKHNKNKKNVPSNIINIKSIESPSSFNPINQKKEIQKEPDKEVNNMSTLKVNYVNPDKNYLMNDTQEKIFEKVCQDIGLEGLKVTIFKDEVEKNLHKGLDSGKTLADFEFRLKSFYKKAADKMYWD